MNKSNIAVSPSQLSTYISCPRKYDYQYDQCVSNSQENERYKHRGIVYHETIAKTCDETEPTDTKTTVIDTAKTNFEQIWSKQTTLQNYDTRPHYQHDKKLTVSGIVSYFLEGGGFEHAQSSVATEYPIETEYKRVHLRGRVDNIVRTDTGLQLIDYKSNIKNIVSSRTVDNLSKHLSGDKYRPKLVQSAIQAAVYLKGIEETDFYEDGMDIEFLFYGVLHNRDMQPSLDGISPIATGKDRNVTNLCLDHHGTIWQLIREAYQGILTMSYDPSHWPAIYNRTCGNCEYQKMCPEYLSEEVRVR